MVPVAFGLGERLCLQIFPVILSWIHFISEDISASLFASCDGCDALSLKNEESGELGTGDLEEQEGHMDGKQANVTVPGYLTRTRTSLSSQCRSLCGCNGLEVRDDWMETPDVVNIRGRLLMNSMVLVEGATGDAPQTPWTSSGAHVIDRLVTFACVTVFCIINRDMGLWDVIAIGWDMMPLLRWSGEARNMHLSLDPSILTHTRTFCTFRACDKPERCTRIGLNLMIMIGKGDTRAGYGPSSCSAGCAEPKPVRADGAVCTLRFAMNERKQDTVADVRRVISESENRSPVAVTVTCAVMSSRLFIRERPVTFNLRDRVRHWLPDWPSTDGHSHFLTRGLRC
ncbi:hypothetical protein EDB89DRAFT_2242837 [Lactarius sanguifluus]|nr:hypothetical protein EDB89DRAFT_2242837 [Lactarius sanguifluus]